MYILNYKHWLSVMKMRQTGYSMRSLGTGSCYTLHAEGGPHTVRFNTVSEGQSRRGQVDERGWGVSTSRPENTKGKGQGAGQNLMPLKNWTEPGGVSGGWGVQCEAVGKRDRLRKLQEPNQSLTEQMCEFWKAFHLHMSMQTSGRLGRGTIIIQHPQCPHIKFIRWV